MRLSSVDRCAELVMPSRQTPTSLYGTIWRILLTCLVMTPSNNWWRGALWSSIEQKSYKPTNSDTYAIIPTKWRWRSHMRRRSEHLAIKLQQRLSSISFSQMLFGIALYFANFEDITWILPDRDKFQT